jgi:hypothetical protein
MEECIRPDFKKYIPSLIDKTWRIFVGKPKREYYEAKIHAILGAGWSMGLFLLYWFHPDYFI